MQVLMIALEFSMRLFLYQHEQITVNAALRRGVALARNRKLHARFHTGRNMNADHLVGIGNPLSAAFGATFRNGLARAVAGRTYLHLLHHA